MPSSTGRKTRSLGKGIHVSWGHKPVDYQMMANILAVLSATAVVAPDFSADDRAIVGPWLNDLVKQAGASFWEDREDNKSFMRTYIAMLWGLVVGDNRPVQDAILEYKLAVHYMRPDGSWPIDSQREQRGLHYNSASTSHLVTIATALQAARGIDLFSYAVDGRSVATAVDFVVASIKDPGTMNKKYAIACPDGGHLNDAGIDHPDLNQYDEAGYLIAYAERFPDRDSSKFILDHYKSQMSIWSEKNGGAPQCLFALAGGDIKLAALVAPPSLSGILKPKLIIHPHEEIAHGDGDGQINSLIQGDIENAKPGPDFLSFNIAGTYLQAQHGFSELDLVIGDPLNAKDEATARQCGAGINTWDDGKHLSIPFTPTKGGYVAGDAKCLSALSGKVGTITKLLLTLFTDIAIGMVTDGTVAAVKDPGLQEFFTDVATGKVTVTAGAS